jgi:hypothetical protein
MHINPAKLTYRVKNNNELIGSIRVPQGVKNYVGDDETVLKYDVGRGYWTCIKVGDDKVIGLFFDE